jgi:hypothetical protein
MHDLTGVTGSPPGTNLEPSIPAFVGKYKTNRLDAPIVRGNPEVGLNDWMVQVKEIQKFGARDVEQTINTLIAARTRTAAGMPTDVVIFLKPGTKLPGPGVAKGLGANVAAAVKSGEIKVVYW